jgi:transposase-like protein
MDLESIIKAIDALPKVNRGTRLDPSEDQRRILLAYWDTGRSHEAISRLLGVSSDTALRWYREAKNDNR